MTQHTVEIEFPLPADHSVSVRGYFCDGQNFTINSNSLDAIRMLYAKSATKANFSARKAIELRTQEAIQNALIDEVICSTIESVLHLCPLEDDEGGKISPNAGAQQQIARLSKFKSIEE